LGERLGERLSPSLVEAADQRVPGIGHDEEPPDVSVNGICLGGATDLIVQFNQQRSAP
jgi:hypothetical protein